MTNTSFPKSGLKSLVAILRGLKPEESVAIASALYEEGFRVLEVPLNSPDALGSIAKVRRALPADCLVGAGTVLSTASADEVKAAGGEIVIMPHADTAVIRHAKALGMFCVPGAATPTEAFAALAAGADAIKMFPAEALPPHVVKAWRAVIPHDIGLLPVGGITPDAMQAFLSAGASGFGLGSALYKPGMNAEQVRANAKQFQKRWHELTSQALA